MYHVEEGRAPMQPRLVTVRNHAAPFLATTLFSYSRCSYFPLAGPMYTESG